MSTLENQTGSTTAPLLPDTLRLGPVQLDVSNLDTSIDYYERVVGLQTHRRDDRGAALGAGGEDLVVLHEQPGAAPGGRHAGLYHFALLFPDRAALARAIRRIADTRTRIDGASDHGVSEAIYLRDPDLNGIELAADRPRDAWPPTDTPGQRYDIYTVALDITSLMDTIAGEAPEEHADPGVVMGHVHLHVAGIERGLSFYRDVLGFEVMASISGAAFVSAGGYHHHVSFNSWLGPDVRPRPDGAAGLRQWIVVLERPEEVEAVRERVRAAGLEWEDRDGGFLVRDPWGTAVVISTSPDA
ncbi:MAG TPA: VOC family protein [Solirubrobacteraceae bacterium]|nr:VOC family protein [Solirubrobacteraceae bacterium]